MAIDTTNLVKFKKGLLANYQGLTTKDSNTLYITTDERAIYLGDKRLGDYIRVANVEALKNVEKKSLDALYYAEAENVLARYNGTTWVQINAAGLTRVIVSGTGNAVAKVEVDPENANALKVTYDDFATLEEHNALKNDLNELTDSFNALAGTGEGSVQDRIDAIQGDTTKTIADVAAEVASNDSDITALQNRVTATEGVANKATSDLATLTETVASNHTAALNAAKAVQGNTTKTVAGLAEEIAGNDSDILGLQNRMSAVEGVASGAASAVEEEAEARIAAVAALQKELDDTQGSVSDEYNSLAKLETKIKANATAIGSNDQDIAALQQADRDILAAIGENSEAIGLLNGNATTVGSVANTVAVEIAKYVNADNDGDAFDTLRDIGTWLSEHSEDAVQMDNRIGANEAAIGILQEDLGELSEAVAGNKTEANNAVNGLRDELLAGTTDYKTLGALETAVKAAKAQANTAEEKADTNAQAIETANGNITKNAEAISALDTKTANNLANAKTEIKGVTDALDGRLETAEGNITSLTGRMDAAEGNIGTNAGNISKNAEGIAANTAAIDKEVKDRGDAITALETAYKAADKALTDSISEVDGKVNTNIEEIQGLIAQLTWGSF